MKFLSNKQEISNILQMMLMNKHFTIDCAFASANILSQINFIIIFHPHCYETFFKFTVITLNILDRRT